MIINCLISLAMGMFLNVLIIPRVIRKANPDTLPDKLVPYIRKRKIQYCLISITLSSASLVLQLIFGISFFTFS